MHRTSLLPLLLAAAAVAAGSLAAQSGGFIVRLGRDTIAVERYSRSGSQIEGESVVRLGAVVHRTYRATLGPDGTVTHFEMITHNIGGAPGPAELRRSMDFTPDSAVAVFPGRDFNPVTTRAAAGPGAVPFVMHTYGLVEYLAARARAADRFPYTVPAVPFGDEPMTATVRRDGGDTLTVTYGAFGTWTLTLDPSGRMTWFTGLGSTTQVDVERVAAIDIGPFGTMFAARPLQPSPLDSTSVVVGGVAVAVKYSRPSVRGRPIFGKVVPWNQVWRTGANAATVFAAGADLDVGGITIPAGRYSLWTIPAPGGWTLIVNRNTGQWGTEYDAQYDQVRLAMAVTTLPTLVEQFTITLSPTSDRGGVLALAWEKTEARITFTVK